jgi:protein-tyrosine phosphatase
MKMFSNIFGKQEKRPHYKQMPFTFDMHSHLIPGVDDGSQSIEESLEMILAFQELGYKKLVTTPHNNSDFYQDNADVITEGYKELLSELETRKIGMELGLSAEYYIDSYFISKIEKGELSHFGNKYVLIETSLSAYPHNFRDVLFELKVHGYQPVFAHPERYSYLWQNKKLYFDFKDSELLFQLNLMSLSSLYSPQVRKIAEMLIDEKLVDFAGTDAHDLNHLQMISKIMNTPYFNKLVKLDLLNYKM